MASGVLLGVLSLRRKFAANRRKRVPQLLIMSVLAVEGTSDLSAMTTGHLSQQSSPRVPRVQNCGLNTALFVTRYLERDTSTREIESALDCGDDWQRPVSMLALRRFLASMNLTVMSYKQAHLSEVVANLDGHNVAIIHVAASIDSSSAGHYLIITARNSSGMLFVVDAGTSARWRDELEVSELDVEFSGFFLIVSQENSTHKSWKLFSDQISISVDRGQTVSGTMWREDLEVMNDSSSPVSLLSTKSSCGCFSSARFQGDVSTLSPGCDGVLELYFHPDRITGAEQEIRLLLRCGNQEMVKTVLFKGDAPDARNRARALPEALRLGDIPCDRSGVLSERIRIVRPVGCGIVSTTCASAAIHSIELVASTSLGETIEDTYRISGELARGERLDSVIKFSLSGKGEREIDVPISAWFREHK